MQRHTLMETSLRQTIFSCYLPSFGEFGAYWKRPFVEAKAVAGRPLGSSRNYHPLHYLFVKGHSRYFQHLPWCFFCDGALGFTNGTPWLSFVGFISRAHYIAPWHRKSPITYDNWYPFFQISKWRQKGWWPNWGSTEAILPRRGQRVRERHGLVPLLDMIGRFWHSCAPIGSTWNMMKHIEISCMARMLFLQLEVRFTNLDGVVCPH